MAKSKRPSEKPRQPKAHAGRAPTQTKAEEKGVLADDQLEQVSGGLQLDEVSFNFAKVVQPVPTDDYCVQVRAWDPKSKR